MGYETAMEVTNECGFTDPEEAIENELPDGKRVVFVLNKGDSLIEWEVETGDRWEEMAVFTHPNASGDWATELAEEIASNDEYRVIFDYNEAEWVLETRVEDD